jgi:hypothetical protein
VHAIKPDYVGVFPADIELPQMEHHDFEECWSKYMLVIHVRGTILTRRGENDFSRLATSVPTQVRKHAWFLLGIQFAANELFF